MTIDRDESGRVKSSEAARALGKKGGGVRKNGAGFALRIRKMRKAGNDYLQFVFAVAMDPDHADFMRAVQFLADREFGKAPQHVKWEGDAVPQVNINLGGGK